MAKKLLVLSVDALFYKDMEFIKDMPNFRMMFEQGSYTKGMKAVYPSLTYPCHVAIMCSQYPQGSGIYHNEKLDPGNPAPPWFWWHKDLKCKTILDYAKEHGLTTAAFNWPVLGGCKNIDYLQAEIWARPSENEDQFEVYNSVCSPAIMDGIYQKYQHHLIGNKTPYYDEFACLCAEDVIRQYTPDVALVHFSLLDHTRHANGLYNNAVTAAMAACDGRFGRLVQAYKDSGVFENTNIIVLGDHGHIPVKQVFNPNIILKEQGLIEVDENGRLKDYKAYCNSAALSCQVVLKDKNDQQTREKVEKILEGFVLDHSIGVQEVITKEQAKELYNLTGDFDYVLEGCDDTAFGNDLTGSVIKDADTRDYKFSVTSHGHMPEKGNDPAFIACGPDIKKGVVLERGSLMDEAPTFAKLLGFEFPNANGRVLEELLK